MNATAQRFTTTVEVVSKLVRFQGETLRPIDYTYDDIVHGHFNESMLEKKLNGSEIVLTIDTQYKKKGKIIVNIDGEETTLVEFVSNRTFYKEQLKVARELIKHYELDSGVKWVVMNF